MMNGSSKKRWKRLKSNEMEKENLVLVFLISEIKVSLYVCMYVCIYTCFLPNCLFKLKYS